MASSALIVVYSPRYRIDIGPHVFPTDKYQRIHARLLETGVIQPSDVVEPEPASWDELALVHSAEYLEKMREGTMSPEDVAQLELPWSQAMVDGFRVMSGRHDPGRAAGVRPRPRRWNAEIAEHAASTKWFCGFRGFCVQRRLSHRRWPAPRVPEPRRRLLPVQRRRRRGAGAAGARPRADRDRRPRRPPRQRHRVHLRIRPARLHLLDAPAAQLPDVEAARLARHRAARRRARRDVSRRARTRVAGGHRSSAGVRVLPRRRGSVRGRSAGGPAADEGRFAAPRSRWSIDAVRRAGVPLVVVLAGGYARRVEDTVAIHAATIEEAAAADARERPATDRS